MTIPKVTLSVVFARYKMLADLEAQLPILFSLISLSLLFLTRLPKVDIELVIDFVFVECYRNCGETGGEIKEIRYFCSKH